MVNNDDEKHLNVDGDADEPQSDDVGRGLGATTKRNNENCSFTRTRKKWENKAV